jgi:hypothetical protein
MLKPMLKGPYVVINQLTKSIWKATHLENILLHMLGEKKYQFNKNWSRLGLLKIRPIFGHSKVYSYLLVKVFVVIFFNPFFFPIMYRILSPYKKYWMLVQNPNYSLYVHFESPLLYDWCMFIEFHHLINIFYSNWQS